MVLKATLRKESSKQSLPQVSFEKVTVQKSIEELWNVISNQMIKYQLSHTRFDQISDHKHGIYLHGELSTKLLAQATSKITRFVLIRTVRHL